MNLDTSIITEWAKAKDVIRIGVRQPQDDGRDLFLMNYYDMEVFFYIPFGGGVVRITNSIYYNYGVLADHMIDTALDNNRKAGYVIKPLADKMAEMAREFGIEIDTEEADVGLYIITNPEIIFGASAIMDIETLNTACNVIGTHKLIIIPSSVHELLVMSGDCEMNEEEITAMINDANVTTVAPGERLADHFYLYEKEIGLYEP